MRPPESSAETEISKFYVSIMVKEDVVRFDIPVDEAHLVDWLYSHGQLSDVKSEKWKNIFMPVTEKFAENTVCPNLHLKTFPQIRWNPKPFPWRVSRK